MQILTYMHEMPGAPGPGIAVMDDVEIKRSFHQAMPMHWQAHFDRQAIDINNVACTLLMLITFFAVQEHLEQRTRANGRGACGFGGGRGAGRQRRGHYGAYRGYYQQQRGCYGSPFGHQRAPARGYYQNHGCQPQGSDYYAAIYGQPGQAYGANSGGEDWSRGGRNGGRFGARNGGRNEGRYGARNGGRFGARNGGRNGAHNGGYAAHGGHAIEAEAYYGNDMYAVDEQPLEAPPADDPQDFEDDMQPHWMADQFGPYDDGYHGGFNGGDDYYGGYGEY
jgi:hypothetical protein